MSSMKHHIDVRGPVPDLRHMVRLSSESRERLWEWAGVFRKVLPALVVLVLAGAIAGGALGYALSWAIKGALGLVHL